MENKGAGEDYPITDFAKGENLPPKPPSSFKAFLVVKSRWTDFEYIHPKIFYSQAELQTAVNSWDTTNTMIEKVYLSSSVNDYPISDYAKQHGLYDKIRDKIQEADLSICDADCWLCGSDWDKIATLATDVVVGEIKELEQWKQSAINVWGPLMNYMQENPPADLKIGQSISQYIINKLKNQKD